MATPRQPKNLAPYNKELRRIERFMRAAEKRGFTFLTTIPERKSKPTKRDVERLRRITPEKLYAKSYYTEGGKVLPGSPYQRGGKWAPTKSGAIRTRQQRYDYNAELKKAEARLKAQQRDAKMHAESEARKAAKKAEQLAEREAKKAATHAAALARRRQRYAEKKAAKQLEASTYRIAGNIAEAGNVIINLRNALERFTPNFRWDDQAKAAAAHYYNFFTNVLDSIEDKIGSEELAIRIQANGQELSEIIDEMLYKYYHTVEEARFNLARFVKLLVGDYANVQSFRPKASQIERSVYRNEYYNEVPLNDEAQEYNEAVGGTRSETYAYDETFVSDMESTLFSIFGGGGSIKVQGGIISLDEFYKGV